MQRIPVESTDIVSIGYDPKERVLEIEFKENRVYQYFDVEPDVHERFMRTDSYGEYFYAHINKHYRYKRVNGEPKDAPTNRKLALVTGNPMKAEIFRQIAEPAGIDFDTLDLPVDEIQSHDAQKITAHKAKQAYKLAGRPVLVNDAFWNILALRGFPGAYMSYINEWFKPEDFLALMKGKSDRTVIRTHSLGYCDGKRTKIFSKDYTATIAEEPRGNGSSFDQLLISAGHTRTNAEIWETERTSSIKHEDSVWAEFVKWYNLQRRLGKV